MNTCCSFTQGLGRMMANSEKTRCPALYRCGRATPSQAGGLMPLGVCNEHVPSAEAKMCSELHRNMQRLAEMTNPALTVLKAGNSLQHEVSSLASACPSQHGASRSGPVQRQSGRHDPSYRMGRQHDDFECFPPRRTFCLSRQKGNRNKGEKHADVN